MKFSILVYEFLSAILGATVNFETVSEIFFLQNLDIFIKISG